MEDLYEKGICQSISVSNFLINHLEQLKEDCKITPHINQVEYHPFQRPQERVDYCRSRNIVFEGYCPLAKGKALTHPNIIQLAKKYGKTPAQICICWSIQNGIVTIPKSTKIERIWENCEPLIHPQHQTGIITATAKRLKNNSDDLQRDQDFRVKSSNLQDSEYLQHPLK
ncbi:putative oxidoreductase YtbE isoform X1 [Chelonoidis abingdonii]|uniref:putative oxidoreductase YtbE isoform X1 n=1 Tax=Chelonoidis abingdonii TaxID=106734 RepID=UPI003F4920A5